MKLLITTLLLLCLSAAMCAVLYRPVEAPEEQKTIAVEAPVVEAAAVETVDRAVADVPPVAEALVDGGPGGPEEAVAEPDVQTEDAPEAVVPAAAEEPSDEKVAEEPAADEPVAEEPEMNSPLVGPDTDAMLGDMPAADEPVAADVPETDVPEAVVPEAEVPAAADVPEAVVPAAADVAEADVPATDVPETDVPEAVAVESDVPAAADDLAADVPTTDVPAADVPVADVPEADVPEADVPIAEVPEVPEEDVPVAEAPEAEVPEPDVPVAEVLLEAEVPEPDVPETDVLAAADAEVDMETVTDEVLAHMMHALEVMDHSLSALDEEEESSWGLGSIRTGFQALNGYFTSLVEIVGGQDGVCQYRCKNGEPPQPRPDFQMPEPDGCTNSLLPGGFQIDLGLPAMTACCDKLDTCYDTCGTSKLRCDSKFRWCVHGLCSDLKNSLGLVSKVQACESMADVLYRTVSTLGCKPYMNSQRAACYCAEEERDEL